MPLKIGFFGTPDIAAYCLEKISARYNVVFTVTCEDKPRGRCQVMTCPEVKDAADRKCIPVFQPCSLKKDEGLAAQLAAFNADIFAVVAFGKIIPREIFAMPRLGSINMHPSLLPKYRGAAPVPWAIICGEQETGVTVQMINEKLDEGDIVLQRAFPLDQNITAGKLTEMLLPVGADMLIEAIEGLASETIVPYKQDHTRANYCGKFDRDNCRIGWNSDSLIIHNLVRGLNPKPAAWTTFRGTNMKVYATQLCTEEIPQLVPGALCVFQKKRLFAAAKNGAVELVELQPENKKRMDALSFINGYHIKEGDLLV